MGWKNWSYVKKGAIVGAGIPFLWYVVSFIWNIFLCKSLFCGEWGLLPLMPLEVFFFILKIQTNIYTLFVYSLILFVILGALIGYIIGKIKSKNKGVK